MQADCTIFVPDEQLLLVGRDGDCRGTLSHSAISPPNLSLADYVYCPQNARIVAHHGDLSVGDLRESLYASGAVVAADGGQFLVQFPLRDIPDADNAVRSAAGEQTAI